MGTLGCAKQSIDYSNRKKSGQEWGACGAPCERAGGGCSRVRSACPTGSSSRAQSSTPSGRRSRPCRPSAAPPRHTLCFSAHLHTLVLEAEVHFAIHTGDNLDNPAGLAVASTALRVRADSRGTGREHHPAAGHRAGKGRLGLGRGKVEDFRSSCGMQNLSITGCRRVTIPSLLHASSHMPLASGRNTRSIICPQ